MGLKVSEVARLSGVSVRALHHYDELGLLQPSGRSEAGYRLYSEEDLQRLQQILFFRELDFPLQEIGRILGARDFDLRSALLMQRRMLEEKASRLHALLRAVDAALESTERGTTMGSHEMFEVFRDFDPSQYDEEVKQRWGKADAYRESKEREGKYAKADWEQIRREAQELTDKLSALLEQRVPASDPRAMEVAEQHRLHIDRWFYPCSPQIHHSLGELYVSDERFRQNIDRVKPGLAQYWRDANVANAERHASAGN